MRCPLAPVCGAARLRIAYGICLPRDQEEVNAFVRWPTTRSRACSQPPQHPLPQVRRAALRGDGARQGSRQLPQARREPARRHGRSARTSGSFRCRGGPRMRRLSPLKTATSSSVRGWVDIVLVCRVCRADALRATGRPPGEKACVAAEHDLDRGDVTVDSMLLKPGVGPGGGGPEGIDFPVSGRRVRSAAPSRSRAGPRCSRPCARSDASRPCPRRATVTGPTVPSRALSSPEYHGLSRSWTSWSLQPRSLSDRTHRAWRIGASRAGLHRRRPRREAAADDGAPGSRLPGDRRRQPGLPRR